jgi:uncharacterized protein (UPF0210 family)
MATSFDSIGQSLRNLSTIQASAQGANEQANAALRQQAGQMTDLVGQLSRRILGVAEEVETSGAALSRSFTTAATRLDQSLSETTRRLDSSIHAFESTGQAHAQKTEAALRELTHRLVISAVKIEEMAGLPTEDKPA